MGREFLGKIIAADESWISFTTPEMQEQSKQWLFEGSGPPRKAKVSFSEKKVMVIAFFDLRGLVYLHNMPKGETINAVYYIDILESLLLLQHLRRKPLSLVEHGWLLHHDNTRPRAAAAAAGVLDQERHQGRVSPTPLSMRLLSRFPHQRGLATTSCATLQEVKAPCKEVVRGISEKKFSDVCDFEREKCKQSYGAYSRSVTHDCIKELSYKLFPYEVGTLVLRCLDPSSSTSEFYFKRSHMPTTDPDPD